MKVGVVLAVLSGAAVMGYLVTPTAAPLGVPATSIATATQLDRPAAMTALSGIWEGVASGTLRTRLVVEALDASSAIVLYAWGDHPEGSLQKGWIRIYARVDGEGTLSWRHPGEFTLRLSADRTLLTGTGTLAGRSVHLVLHRVPAGVALKALTRGEE